MKVKFDAKEDYYLRLGVVEAASLNDIKRAYRRLALKTHPDVNKAKDAAEQFKKVCEAYKVLSDPEVRKQYDLARKYRDPSASYYAGGGGRASGGGKQWYDGYYDPSTGGFRRGPQEETRDTIDDSFSKIFSDFIGTASTRGGRGILEDLVDFLEESVDGFSDDSSDDFEDLLRSDNLSEIQEEVENLNFLILKLREKLHQAQLDRMMAESDVRNYRPDPRDIDALEKRMEKVEREAAVRARCVDLEGHIKRADKRQRRLMLRAEELRWGPGGSRPAYSKYVKPGTAGSASSRANTSSSSSSSSSSGSSSSGSSSSSTYGGSGYSSGSSSSSSKPSKKDVVEEELRRMKREMGIGD